MVEFHWVPGHTGVVGNEVADIWAGNACMWFADVALPAKQDEVLVMPLNPIEFDEPWGLNCQLLTGKRPTGANALQILEDSKHLQYVLKGDVPTSPPEKVALPKKTIANDITTQQDALEPIPKQPTGQAKTKKGRKKTKATTSAIPANEAALDQTLKPAASQPKRPPKSKKGRKKTGGVESVPLNEPDQQHEKKTKPRCKICGGKRHTEEQCPQTHPCGACGAKGHEEQRCVQKYPCERCGKLGHREKRCDRKKNYKPNAVTAEPMIIPCASMIVNCLHPTLMGISCHGSDSRYMLGRVGLSPHLSSNIVSVPCVSLGLAAAR